MFLCFVLMGFFWLLCSFRVVVWVFLVFFLIVCLCLVSVLVEVFCGFLLRLFGLGVFGLFVCLLVCCIHLLPLSAPLQPVSTFSME